MFYLTELEHPIVQAPMAGGTSTVELARAVCEAGGLGFLAAGYVAPADLRSGIESFRESTDQPFGVNVFAPAGPPAGPDAVRRFAEGFGSDAELGTPRHDDDNYDEKVELLAELSVPVVSFTFGCPDAREVGRLRDAGTAVWITVTTPEEARLAAEAGADALVVQGVEAGGHRGSFDDTAPGEIGLLALLRLVAGQTNLPLVAAGGLGDGAGIAGALIAGASAVQLGTAFMLCPEAGTTPAHRAALTTDAPTALTRAFTGRTARSIVNGFMREHGDAPAAYPEIHHLTNTMRRAARAAGDPDGFQLWAGQGHQLARELPAGEVVRLLTTETREATQAVSESVLGLD